MIRLGFIAEDMSDVGVMREITGKVLPAGSFGTRHFVGQGCGRLKRKCRVWAEQLLQKGCTHIVVVHDLDDEIEKDLRHLLERAMKGVGGKGALILIPIYEIEAWLLTDGMAIKEVFSLQKEPKIPKNPESISDPKGSLEELVWRAQKKRYINTVHNESIAAAARLSQLEQCISFRPYPEFLRKALPKKARAAGSRG